MSTVASQKVVSIDYTLKNNNGEVLDTSNGREPLSYLHGSGNIIPGLEKALEGKQAGEQLAVTIEPAEAYGERDERMVQQIPKEQFAEIPELAVGQQVRGQTPEGTHVLTVVDIADDAVTVDANHQLAGETLNFDVKVVEVRDATEEELQHGHAHGAGGHQH